MGSIAEQQTPVDIESLLQQLTIEEKISLLAGQNVWETNPVERLNIPSLKVTDGPNGARGATFYDGTTAACFPSCVSIAATFNLDLTRRIGKALGQEAQTKAAYVLLGPTVCCHRSPLGGRNFESFSEDPLLSGVLAAEYVKGLQSERVGATVKHYLGNEQDTRRFSVNEIISERALREIYMRPFEIVVKTSDPWCIMSSYPKINGKHVDQSNEFLQEILRDEWKFDGLVMSDWGATTSSINSINAGLDLEMPGITRFRSTEVLKAVIKKGEITPKTIDNRARAVLQLLERTGKFSDRREQLAEKAIDLPEHRKLIREAGAEGIVLLKNDNQTLPIDATKIKKIALLGPLAKYAAAHGGGSASLNSHYKISPFDAFTERLGKDVEISYSKGAHIFRVYPDLEAGIINADGNPGFTAEYFKNHELSGDPFFSQPFPRGAFITLMDLAVEGQQAIRFSTKYTPATTGRHYLSFSGMGPSKLYIDDVLVSEQKECTRDSMAFLLGTQDEEHIQYPFIADKSYAIRIETHVPEGSIGELFLLDGQSSVHLGFIEEAEMDKDVLAEAVSLAENADFAIVFVGNNMQWETEGEDMKDMHLPADGSQDRLISAITAVNPKTIVVNSTGVAITAPWLSDVPVLMQTWYAGQEVGNCIVDVLLGKVNPSGKLPISWPKEYEHTAVIGHFGLDSYESREAKYIEGVYVGYRHFDRHYGSEKEVLFPFGFGLSYSTFTLTNPSLTGDINTGISVTVEIANTSSIAGAEVVQVYVAPPSSSKIDRPKKGLAGFQKVFLQGGEMRKVSIEIQKDSSAFWDVSQRKWLVEAGTYGFLVGTSSSPADLRLKLSVMVEQEFAFGPEYRYK